MSINIILSILFSFEIVFGGVCKYELAYKDRWPHCANLGACFQNTKISQAMTKCDSLSQCVGFSFTANANDNTLGHGCYKHNNNNECATNGFGTGSHGFYRKENNYKKIYDKHWPHCLNLNINGVTCFNDKARDVVEKECDSNPLCVGFSFTTDSEIGHGCYKQNTNNACQTNGLGSGSHDYWEKKSTCVDYSDCYAKLYDRKWPHCTNIRCFNGITKEDAKDSCDTYDNCIGFSFTASIDDWTKGTGCLKQNPNNICSKAGYGYGSHDYFQRQRYSKIFSGKWPHCSNLGACFNNINIEQASNVCDSNNQCIGFSFTSNANDYTKGSGCYKQRNNCNGGGFGLSSHEYYGKCRLTTFNNEVIFKAKNLLNNNNNNIDNSNLFSIVKNNNIYIYTLYFILLPILSILLLLILIYKSCINNNKNKNKYKYISTSESDTSSDNA